MYVEGKILNNFTFIFMQHQKQKRNVLKLLSPPVNYSA